MEQIKNDFDFWKDATSFLKTVVVPDLQEKIAEHIKDSNFNDNEARFFRVYLEKAFDMESMFSYLKYTSKDFGK